MAGVASPGQARVVQPLRSGPGITRESRLDAELYAPPASSSAGYRISSNFSSASTGAFGSGCHLRFEEAAVRQGIAKLEKMVERKGIEPSTFALRTRFKVIASFFQDSKT